MNYLAHVFLAGPECDSQVGNLLGDFVKPKHDENYSRAIQRGIVMHRKVDRFTDQHPATRQAKRLFHESRRRFSGILVDVFADHYLIKNWARYHPQTSTDFAAEFNRHLSRFASECQQPLAARLAAIASHNVLLSCQKISGVERVLNRIDSRISRATTMPGASEDYLAYEAEFATLYEQLFADLIDFSEEYRNAELGPHEILSQQ